MEIASRLRAAIGLAVVEIRRKTRHIGRLTQHRVKLILDKTCPLPELPPKEGCLPRNLQDNMTRTHAHLYTRRGVDVQVLLRPFRSRTADRKQGRRFLVALNTERILGRRPID